jgi:nitrogen fixation/metabolism regulation signal transduction histidine kinase
MLRIVSFQDIKFEIEQNEAEAWQKLIRILTHEIMNSLSPITLTSSGIIQTFEKEGEMVDIREIDEATWKNVLLGLHAIRKRSKGLASFIESYQTINQLPQPVLSQFSVGDMVTQIEMLMAEELQNKAVNFDASVIPPSLMLEADERLVSQILINLVQNAIYALENRQEKKTVRLHAFQINDQVRISVTDNGKGIPPELLDSIFVPFFTTRQRGSGIGLSIAREIMKLHGGGIRVHSDPGKETTFTLVF